MYIVQNMTRHEIALGDLRATIKPSKQADLDHFAARYVVEQSRDLRIALKRGALRLVRKDNPLGNNETQPIAQKAKPVKTLDQSDDVMKALRDMEKRLGARLDNQVEKQVSSSGGINEENANMLKNAIESLQDIASGNISQKQNNTAEYEIEDEKAVDIHERSINRIVKDTESNISHNEELGSSDADDNISELEDML